MNQNERIESALRRRPSDEREYEEPLVALAQGDGGVQRVRPATRSRVRAGALPALAAIAVVLALGAGALTAGFLRGPALTAGGHNDFELTGRVDCFGQAPGAFTPGPDLFPSDFGCPLLAVPPAGYGAATWELDPSYPYSAGATEIHVLVQELSCNSGENADGRIAGNVQYSDDSVMVTLAVRPRGGAQRCPSNPPTPFILRLDQPVGLRALTDGGRWPAETIATGGHAVVTPSPTPYPSNWHMPIDCTGEADGPGSFKAASMSATFDVYCAALPAGWRRDAMSGDEQVTTFITVTYRGPNEEILELDEGNVCTSGPSACAPGNSLGTALFGDREGQIVGGPPGADYALYVAPGESPSWKATGKGMTLDTFKALTAALIIVAK